MKLGKTCLGSIAQVKNGFAFKSKEYIGSGLRVVRITNVQKGEIVDSNPQFVDESRTDEFKEYLLFSGDILISLTGNVGRVGVLTKDLEPAVLNQRVACIRVKNKKEVYSKYLFLYLNSDLFERECINNSNGIAQLNLSSKWVENYQIPLPPLYDQIRIAAVLTRAAVLIAKHKESIKALDEFLKSTFLEMFGDPVSNEKGLLLSPLGERLSIKHGFAFQGKYFSNTGEYVLLTPGNFFEEGGYRDRGDKQKYYQGEIPQEYLLNKGDLLIAMTEQAPGLLGSSLIVPDSNKFLHNQRLGLIILKKDDLNRFYLFHLFNHHNIRRLIHSKATGTKVRHTSPSKIEEIKVLLPPLSLQNQFAAIVEKVEALKARYTQSLTELENLYGSLSQLAFKGELDLSKVPMERGTRGRFSCANMGKFRPIIVE